MKTAMIWGAAGGIGQACLSHLQEKGWTTIGIAKDTTQISSIATHSFDADFEDPSMVDQVVFLASQIADQVDLWIYTAGDISSSKVSDIKPADAQRIISANLTSAIFAIHSSLPLLSEEAHIFFIGAVSERLRLPGLSAYAAAKAGLEAFADTLRKEERKKLVTVVRPSAVATNFWDKVPLNVPADAAPPEKIAKKILEAYDTKHKGQLDLI
ncbi:MAG: SDR family NAD(P)-dependent oxidoreductase [Aliifodinibius sp.]|nr:SDR family NAD(P)-dependent oxidoreductase [Fodinibius sp.]